MKNEGYKLRVRDLLESPAVKGKDLEFCRKANETCEHSGEGDLDQDDRDKITELWERYY